MTILAFALCFAGFICLSLSMSRHYRQLWPQRTPARGLVSGLRTAGYGALALALVPAIEVQGTSVGIVLWFGLLTIAALAVVLLLTYQPGWLVRLGSASVVMGAVVACL